LSKEVVAAEGAERNRASRLFKQLNACSLDLQIKP
jgi:hypothetical protein